MPDEILFSLKKISKTYKRRNDSRCVLEIERLEISKGKITSIMGYSGAGKSTLLNILGLLDNPDWEDASAELIYFEDLKEESIPIEYRKLWHQKHSKILELRRKEFGFIFQESNLLSNYTFLQNINIFSKLKTNQGCERSDINELCDSLGLRSNKKKNDIRYSFPNELSGGEKQRLSIVRALALKPKILFADEPTANLDLRNRDSVFKLFRQHYGCNGKTMIFITHDWEIAHDISDEIILLDNGRIVPGPKSLKWLPQELSRDKFYEMKNH